MIQPDSYGSDLNADWSQRRYLGTSKNLLNDCCIGRSFCLALKLLFQYPSGGRTAQQSSAAMTGLCYLLRDFIIRAFLTEPASFEYAITFTNILLSTSFLFGVFYVLTNALQSMGAATQALIINLSRQGIIYIPALYILQMLLYLWTARKRMAAQNSFQPKD